MRTVQKTVMEGPKAGSNSKTVELLLRRENTQKVTEQWYQALVGRRRSRQSQGSFPPSPLNAGVNCDRGGVVLPAPGDSSK
jgi:hypothetical protein